MRSYQSLMHGHHSLYSGWYAFIRAQRPCDAMLRCATLCYAMHAQ